MSIQTPPIWLLFGTFLAWSSAQVVLGDVETESGGIRISLGAGWEAIKEPGTFFVQEQARNADRGMMAAIGSFRIDLSLAQYTAIAVGKLTTGSDSQLNYVARQLDLTRVDLDKILASPLGKKVGDEVAEASRTMRFELISITKRKFGSSEGFEIHSRVTKLDTGQTLYSRQFMVPGAAQHEIVQVGFIGVVQGIFSQKDLVDALRPLRKAK